MLNLVFVFVTEYTGWHVELEHLKIETRLINERFPSVMGECVIWTRRRMRGESGTGHGDVVETELLKVSFPMRL